MLAQARRGGEPGSAMYAEPPARAADDPGGAVTGVLGERAEAGGVLRMLGTVHRLLLSYVWTDQAARVERVALRERPSHGLPVVWF